MASLLASSLKSEGKDVGIVRGSVEVVPQCDLFAIGPEFNSTNQSTALSSEDDAVEMVSSLPPNLVVLATTKQKKQRLQAQGGSDGASSSSIEGLNTSVVRKGKGEDKNKNEFVIEQDALIPHSLPTGEEPSATLQQRQNEQLFLSDPYVKYNHHSLIETFENNDEDQREGMRGSDQPNTIEVLSGMIQCQIPSPPSTVTSELAELALKDMDQILHDFPPLEFGSILPPAAYTGETTEGRNTFVLNPNFALLQTGPSLRVQEITVPDVHVVRRSGFVIKKRRASPSGGERQARDREHAAGIEEEVGQVNDTQAEEYIRAKMEIEELCNGGAAWGDPVRFRLNDENEHKGGEIGEEKNADIRMQNSEFDEETHGPTYTTAQKGKGREVEDPISWEKQKEDLQNLFEKERAEKEILAAQNYLLIDERDRLEDHLTCGVCTEILVGAHSTVPCGHTFCGPCIVSWQTSASYGECMICRTKLDKDIVFSRNVLVDSVVETWMSARSLEEREEYERKTADWILKKDKIRLIRSPATAAGPSRAGGPGPLAQMLAQNRPRAEIARDFNALVEQRLAQRAARDRPPIPLRTPPTARAAQLNAAEEEDRQYQIRRRILLRRGEEMEQELREMDWDSFEARRLETGRRQRENEVGHAAPQLDFVAPRQVARRSLEEEAYHHLNLVNLVPRDEEIVRVREDNANDRRRNRDRRLEELMEQEIANLRRNRRTFRDDWEARDYIFSGRREREDTEHDEDGIRHSRRAASAAYDEDFPPYDSVARPRRLGNRNSPAPPASAPPSSVTPSPSVQRGRIPMNAGVRADLGVRFAAPVIPMKQEPATAPLIPPTSANAYQSSARLIRIKKERSPPLLQGDIQEKEPDSDMEPADVEKRIARTRRNEEEFKLRMKSILRGQKDVKMEIKYQGEPNEAVAARSRSGDAKKEEPAISISSMSTDEERPLKRVKMEGPVDQPLAGPSRAAP